MNRMALLTALVLCSVSCVMLDLKQSDSEAVDSAISFDCSWPDASGSSSCDSLFALMNRSTDGVRYLFCTEVSKTLPDTVAIFGQYVAMAYACNTRDYDIDQRSSFLSSQDVYIRDFTARAHNLSQEAVEALKGNSGLDFNASYRFIDLPSQIYSSSSLITVSDVSTNLFTFKLQPLLTALHLDFILKAEPSVRIASVSAELSGVPASINMKDASTSAADLARVLFPVTRQSDGSCSASILITGFYPSESAELLTGPGILRLCVSAESEGNTKILHPAINLRDLIVSKNIMVPTVQDGRYETVSRSIEISVPAALLVGRDSFESSGGGDGVGTWYDGDVPIDVEL